MRLVSLRSISYQLVSFFQHSGHCTSGFPDEISFQGSGRGERERVTTRLFTDMKFGCVGTIVGFKAAVLNDSGSQSQQPLKIQVWRESESQPGLFFKMCPDDIQIWNRSNHPCYPQNTLSNKHFSVHSERIFKFQFNLETFLGLKFLPSTRMTLKFISKLEDQLTLFFMVN